MRITYRDKTVKEYWEKRWSDIPIDASMENSNIYPIKYAKLTIKSNKGKILEAGCGAGRILRYYKDRGYDIIGMDFIDPIIKRLKKTDPNLNVAFGDIANLKYDNQTFRAILAFGIYHNLEKGLTQAIHETYRVLEPGGKVCASFRADNIQTWLTDWLFEYRFRKNGNNNYEKKFHKINLKHSEVVDLFQAAGFHIHTIYPVENMPIFYKFAFLRSQKHKKFNENIARKEGYKLSSIGNILQKAMMHYFPKQFCNLFVIIAQRPKS